MKNLTLRQRQRIAREVSKTVHGRCEITEQTVREIETGVNFTASHPVHQRIMAAINVEKLNLFDKKRNARNTKA